MNNKKIKEILAERILVLDGGLGTMVQGYGLEEKDYRGEKFADWNLPLKGCNDVLALTAPKIIKRIHEAYLLAGADIISTDSFNSNAISLADYGLEAYGYEINYAAARIAREIADNFTLKNPGKPRFVAGSVGPTSKTASMSADVNNPASREVTFDDLRGPYSDQIKGLLDGGADIILIETVFDTLNAKVAIFALQRESEKRGYEVPVMISGTLADASGRTLSGQVIEAFYTSVTHASPLAVGFNCAYGAKQLQPYLERLSAISEYPVSAHPNAGLPNIMGGYDETPQMMADDIEEYMRHGLVNIVGGCCGTTPAHIGAISRLASKYPPRTFRNTNHETVLSGLERLKIIPDTNFINIGERTNVAGSAKFARMIREERYEDALSVAREQVDAGAQIVDICMDDGLIDGVAAMTNFLNIIAAEPEIARVPFMIDSSSWEVLEAGLKCVQGKSIVNSISLKEGEAEFVRKARLVHSYGAAAVVMLFDESGQADSYSRKIEVAGRAYKILVHNGFPPEDIIFDPNVLAIATGIEQHNNYGVDFIESVRWIKQNLPYAKVSGGISNLSFAFRGNNKIREAMHSVFLFHAIAAGLDMGIVNPSMLQVYSDIDPELLQLTEDVVLNRRSDATERLAAYAEKVKNSDGGKSSSNDALQWRHLPLAERIAYAMKKGVTDFVEEDVSEALRVSCVPLSVIDNYLMPVMAEIGVLFGEGKMFLPQVVKSARVMKKAVGVLTPFIEEDHNSNASSSHKILIATVKGDVHDIGKNIVSVVMACNGYDVNDLGVMVECPDIVDTAQSWRADVIGLSGLISPSLDEMIKVVKELEKRGLNIPVIIGGATTSELHTAVKIAPEYKGGIVIHSRDASENIGILNRLLGSESAKYKAEVKKRQEELREQYKMRNNYHPLVSLETARKNRYVKPSELVISPNQTAHVVFKDYPVSEVVRYIDWNFFFPAWEIKGRYPEILDSPEKGAEARKLLDDAHNLLERIDKEKLLQLNGVVGIYPAGSEGDDIIVTDGEGKEFRLAQLRNQENKKISCEKGTIGNAGNEKYNLCLADYVKGKDCETKDYIGAFAVTAGLGLKGLSAKFREEGDEYSAIMAKLLADRLTEAFAEAVHSFVRRVLWGYEKGEEATPQDIIRGRYQGIRVAFGYPACPDHSLKKDVFELLKATEATTMTITENYMIDPGEALCGLMFANEDAQYFSVGKIDKDQLKDYARRRKMSSEQIARLIPQHLQ